MKVKIFSTVLVLFLSVMSANAQCSRDLTKHEKYSTGPIIHSKQVTFHSPTLTNKKDISAQVKDSSRFFIHFDLSYGTWRVGSKVDFKLESGTVVSTYITKWESETSGSYSVKRYDCQIMDRDQLDLFFLQEVEKITVHCVGKTYTLSSRESKKFNEYFKCAANTVGIENINFTPAKKTESDPYVDNTIVVSFGTDNSQPTYDDVNCEYEKNEVDEFTGKRTTITKMAKLGENLTAQIHAIDNKTFINFKFVGALGCANVSSFVIFKFTDGTTLKLMNLAPEDCGENPILKVEISENISIMKVRDIDKIRLSYSDAHADVEVTDSDLIQGILHKCIK